MSHNILLLFLSDVKVTSDRKKLLPPVPYPGLGRTMTTNESAVRYLAQKNEVNADTFQIEKLFAFATDKVRNQYVGQNYAGDTVHAEDAVDQEGTPLTHLAYFKYRLQSERIIEDIEHCMPEDDEEKGIVGTVCPFDDTSNDVKENMKTIVGMANRIQTYIQTLPEDERNKVVLHADMTGGFRHASMMMLAVMRLMQYQGVEIGHVVYSNFNKSTGTGTVQEIGEIYHMFDLIAGAEEFATFGSVKTISTYFNKRKKTAGLDSLIKSMENFAEAVKLTRRKDFDEAIDVLHSTLKNFDKVRNSGDLNDTLMGLLEKRVKQDYSHLFSKEKDSLTPIEWCLEHDYLQQALSLYTESIPDFLFSSGILSIEPRVLETVEKAKPETDRRETLFFLFSDYTPRSIILRSKELEVDTDKAIVDATHKVLEALQNNDADSVSKAKNTLQNIFTEHNIEKREWDNFNAVFDSLDKIRQQPALMKDLNALEPDVKIPLQNVFIKFKDDLSKNDYGTKKVKKIFKGLLNISSADKLYELFLFEYKKAGIKQKYPHCKGLYNLFYQNIIHINKKNSEEDILKAMQTYFEIKEIRNDSAHAKLNPQGNQLSADELRQFMLEGIKHLRVLKRRVKRVDV